VLNATATNGSASVAGSYAYTNGGTAVTAATVLPIGSYTLQVNFTPTDTIDYATATGTTTLRVTNQKIPAINWAAPAAIAYGNNLSGVLNATATNGGATVAGSYAYTNGSTAVTAATVLQGGSYTLQVTFTPTNSAEYATATGTIALRVTQLVPAISWAAPATIAYGASLSSVLNAKATNGSASVAGSYAYTNGSTAVTAATVLPAGSYTLQVNFTPTETADYATATSTITLRVTQLVPAIYWAAPAAIASGASLSSTQLNATSSVPGSFVYNPAAGTVLPAGTATLSVTFTPEDTIDYASATQTVQLVVNAAPNFKLTVNPATLTIKAGASGTATVTLTPMGKFNGVLGLSCTGLPANSTCTFSPSAITDDGATVKTTMTIATAVQTSSLAAPSPSVWTRLAVPFGGSGFGGLLALCLLPRRKTRTGWRAFLSAILVLAALGAGISTIGCGGMVGAITPPGSATVVVSASTSAAGGTSQTAELTVIIVN
jgi:hypothetical protein